MMKDDDYVENILIIFPEISSGRIDYIVLSEMWYLEILYLFSRKKRSDLYNITILS